MWSTSVAGMMLSEEEANRISKVLESVFGYHLVVIASDRCESTVQGARIRHKILVSEQAVPRIDYSAVGASFEALPFQNDSIDAVIIAHGLEGLKDPQALLEELYRVLLPNGHLLITGFNPSSLWGIAYSLKRLFIRRFKPHVSMQQLIKSIRLLGFEVTSVSTCFFRPHLDSKRMLEKLAWLEPFCSHMFPYWGASYLVVAQKKVTPLTLIRPQWQPVRVLWEPGVAKPSIRSSSGINE